MKITARNVAVVLMVVGGMNIASATSFSLGAGIMCIGLDFIAIADMFTTQP